MKQWFRRHAITSKQKRLARNKRFHSFDTAKKVGLVFTADQEVPGEVVAMMKFLKGRGVSCSLLGYHDGKKLPEKLSQFSDAVIFTGKDLGWYGRPQAEGVTRFLQNAYDIVIDFCRQGDVYPIQYVVSTVQASMIIGGVQYARCPYDVIVDAQQQSTQGGYVEQIKHYLSIFNNPQKVELQKN